MVNSVVSATNCVRNTILSLLMVLFILGAPDFSLGSSCNLSNVVSEWAGKYPISRSKNLIKEYGITQRIEKLIGKRYSKRLLNLEREPYYLIQPVRYELGYFIFDYAPNLSFYNDDNPRLVIFLNVANCSSHAAILYDNGRISWRHLGKNDLPNKLTQDFDLPPK